MTNSEPTPRTDEIWKAYCEDEEARLTATDIMQLSRQLERELSKLQAEREGHVLVPKEPTMGMIHEIIEAKLRDDSALDIYRAMIAASQVSGGG